LCSQKEHTTPITSSTTDASYAVSFFPKDHRIVFTPTGGGDALNHAYVLDHAGPERDLTPGAKLKAHRRLAARGETPAAFGRRCIPGGGVAPPSNTPGILGRRALPSGRLAALGATLAFHHGLLGACRRFSTPARKGARRARGEHPRTANPGL
jgi:hypothetical protein